jgi:rRNA maturation endonuclease Nob1
MLKRVSRKVWRCVCDLCGHPWDSLAENPPAVCPECGSRAWNGVKRIGRPIVLRDRSTAGLPRPHRPRLP